MKTVEFKTLSITNFLSFGKEVTIPLNKTGIFIITGHNHDKDDGNGAGKCVDKSTKIDIQITDIQALKDFNFFLKKK